MKKLILTLLFAIGMIASTFAQKTDPVLMPTTKGGTKTVDTTDNTETNYVYYQIPSTAKSVGITIVGTKLSGSPNGVFTIEYSNFSTLTSTAFAPLSVADTVHMNNSATASVGTYGKESSSCAALPYKWIRVKSQGRGTASYKFQAYFYIKE